jgi:hypothetical protein
LHRRDPDHEDNPFRYFRKKPGFVSDELMHPVQSVWSRPAGVELVPQIDFQPGRRVYERGARPEVNTIGCHPPCDPAGRQPAHFH